MAAGKRRLFVDDRHLKRRLKRPIWIITLVLCGIILGQSFHVHSRQRQADELYGVWDGSVYDISEEEFSYINTLPMVEQTGFQHITGTVTDKEGMQWGSLGWADEGFYHQANLKLKTGRMPMKENELAVEANVLDSLDIAYTPGQIIELQLMDETGNVAVRTFTLTGVLENYAQYWNGEGDILHFFTGKAMPTDTHHLFFKMKAGYEEAAGKILLSDHVVITNENRKVATDPFSPDNLFISVLLILLVLFCGVLLEQVLFDWEFEHRKEMRLLKVLGCRTDILLKNLGLLLVKCWIGPAVMLAVCLMISRLPVSWMLLLALLYAGMILLALTFFLGLLMVELKEKKPKRRKGHKSVVITANVASRRLTNFLRPLQITKLFLLLLGLVIVLFSASRVLTDLKSIKATGQQDFLLQGASWLSGRYTQDDLHWFNDERVIIPESAIREISQISDVDILSQCHEVMVQVSWKNMDRALFADETGKPDEKWQLLVQPDENGNPAFYRPVIETSYEPTVEMLKNSISEGSVDWDKWAQGQQAIVNLPPMKLTETEISSAWNGIRDDSLHVGDEITLTYPDGTTRTLPVTGIMRNNESLPVYGIYTGGQNINRMQLALTSRENRIPVELRLSEICAQYGLSFNNLAQWNEAAIQRLQMDILLQAGTLVFTISVGWFGLLFVKRLQADREEDYISKLERAGLRMETIEQIRHSSDRRRQWNMVTVLLMAGMMICTVIILNTTSPVFCTDLFLVQTAIILFFMMVSLII